MLLAVDGSGGKVPPANCAECSWKSPQYRKHLAADCDHLLCHGFYAATLDIDRFDRMLGALPSGQLALRTGSLSRLLVIDAEAVSKDPGEPSGLEVLDDWSKWVQADWSLPETLRSRSVSGGVHLYYRIPADVQIRSGRVLPNIDVKGESGYVGAVSGQTSRSWENPGTAVADAPAELLDWLANGKRLGTGCGVGSAGVGRPEGYDFTAFQRHCPDGFRDHFFNDLAFRLRKSGLAYAEYENEIYEIWKRAAQPPDARYEMPWDDVKYKLDRVWATVEPDPPTPGLLWAREIMRHADRRRRAALVHNDGEGGAGGNGSGDGDDGGVSVPPILVGELEPPDRWYGTNDDGTAQRMLDVWGDWFRAIPRQRGSYAWLRYEGVIWEEDDHERIWDATGHLVTLIERELTRWENRCTELDLEGVEDWRTARVGGNGAQAEEFRIIVALRKYAAACRENARKESGVKAFARRPEITIAEKDLDAEHRFIGLLDGRVLDVEAVHTGQPQNTWLLDARPEMLLTKQLGCGYTPPDQNRPTTLYEFSNFRRYLEAVLPSQAVRDTLQEIIGYALLGKPEEKLVVLLHGPPDSGKTVLLEVAEALFGGYGGWTDGQALIAGKAKSAHTEWLHKLRGLRLVITPETAKGAKIDAAWMKSYSGREPQTTRGAYGDRTLTWPPTGIIFNASNHYIEYDAEDTAVAERTQVIEFEKQFLRGDKDRDDQLPQKIKNHELPIVLNWALAGLARRGARTDDQGVRKPHVEIAPEIRVWSERYRTAQDHIGQFITDAVDEEKLCVIADEAELAVLPTSHFVSAKVVYALYQSWCIVQNRKPVGRNNFNAHLKRVYNRKDGESHGKRWIGWTSTLTDPTQVMFVSW